MGKWALTKDLSYTLAGGGGRLVASFVVGLPFVFSTTQTEPSVVTLLAERNSQRRESVAARPTDRPVVLILGTSFLPVIGGLQIQLKWFLDAIDRGGDTGLNFHFAYPTAASAEYAVFHNLDVHDLDIRGRGATRALRLLARLVALLRRIKPAVVHYHALTPDGGVVAAACRLSGVHTKIVATSHGNDVVWLPDVPYGSLGRWYVRLHTRAVTKTLAAHVVVSHAMARHAARAGTPQQRIRVIHDGLPGPEDYDFETEPDSGPPVPHLGLERRANGMDILCMSSARAVKNISTLIDAFAIARDELGHARLYLTCVGALAEPIRDLVRNKRLTERVGFLGTIRGAQKRAYLRHCDAFCMPSHFEAFGLAALEAMKYGTAVIATRSGGIPDFVEDGVNGILVSPNDPVELARALVRLARAPAYRRQLALKGRETAARFTVSSTVEQHIGLYRELIA